MFSKFSVFCIHANKKIGKKHILYMEAVEEEERRRRGRGAEGEEGYKKQRRREEGEEGEKKARRRFEEGGPKS